MRNDREPVRPPPKLIRSRVCGLHSAFAYLDGGSISLVIAAIGGGVAGLGVFARAVWHRIGRWIRRNGSPLTDAR